MTDQPPKSPRLNAIGKPLSPLYDPNYKIKTPLTSISRLRTAAPTPTSALRMSGGLDEEQRWKAVRACISRGDKAKRKAEDFYITAGQHLKELKKRHDDAGRTWAEWVALLKDKGVGKSRASELMQIADGTKTVDQVRADTAERNMALRERNKISPSRDGESAPAPEPKAAAAPAMKAEAEPKQAKADDRMPTEEEAEESYQETIFDQACLLLESMTDERRHIFFVDLWGDFRDELIAAQTVAYKRAVPPKPVAAAPVENAPSPDVSAEIMKAQIAAIADTEGSAT
jgi:hypothetical protein